jgi:hypothetical protein
VQAGLEERFFEKVDTWINEVSSRSLFSDKPNLITNSLPKPGRDRRSDIPNSYHHSFPCVSVSLWHLSFSFPENPKTRPDLTRGVVVAKQPSGSQGGGEDEFTTSTLASSDSTGVWKMACPGPEVSSQLLI